MCTPEAQIAAAVFQGIQGQNAAVEQANRQNAMYLENAQNARTAATDDQRALNMRIGQEGDAASQQRFAALVQGLRNSGTATTAAGEAGVSGNSVSALLADLTRQTTVQQGTITRNFDMTKNQLEQNKEATKSTFTSRVNGVQKGSAPSATDALLGIGINAGMAYGSATMQANQTTAINNQTAALKARGSSSLPPKATVKPFGS